MAAYTHGYGEAVLGSHRARTAANSAAHLLPHLRTGQRLLDVGSGAGTITADLARLVGPEHLVALEVAEESAALTRAELDRQGLLARPGANGEPSADGEAHGAASDGHARPGAEVVVGDAHDLPFEDGTFDVVHAHQVLQHVAAPVGVLRELRRVTRPGGLVAVRDSDYEGFRWWPDLPGLSRWRELYLRVARTNGGTPDAGRRLLAWAHAAGFTDVEPSTSTWLYATPESRESWAASWAGRITSPPLAAQLEREGWADEAEREEIAETFRRWSADPDGWFTLLHGEILARV